MLVDLVISKLRDFMLKYGNCEVIVYDDSFDATLEIISIDIDRENNEIVLTGEETE